MKDTFLAQFRIGTALAVRGFGKICGNDLFLVACVLLIESLIRPYRGIVHDSRLYAFLVQNELLGGAQGSDLFIKFGSQNDFTIFSFPCVAIAAVIGLKPAFFLLYVLGRALFWLGLTKLYRHFILEDNFRAIALFLTAFCSIPYCGFDLLAINEPFLTPRLYAHALAVFAVSALLEKQPRLMRSAALFIAAILLHPLIGVPVLLVIPVAAGWYFFRETAWFFYLSLGCVYAGAILCTELLARLVGMPRLDPEWLAVITKRSPFYFPDLWPISDLLRAVIQIIAVFYLSGLFRPAVQGFLKGVACVAALSLFTALISTRPGSAVFVQLQLYRALWLASLMTLPLAIALLERLYEIKLSRPFANIGGALLVLEVTALAGGFFVDHQVLIVLFVLVAISFGLAGFLTPSQSVSGLFACFLVLLVLAMLAPLFIKSPPLTAALAGAAFALGSVAGLLLFLGSDRGNIATISACILLFSQSAYLLTGTYRYPPSRVEKARAASVLSEKIAGFEGTPVIYWPGMLDEIWFLLKASSFYNNFQTAGVVFNRETAVAAKHRAELTAPFEARYYWRWTKGLYHGSFNAIPALAEGFMSSAQWFPGREPALPTEDNLKRLCMEPDLDYVVLDRPIGDDREGNEPIFIYDCASLYRSGEASPIINLSQGP